MTVLGINLLGLLAATFVGMVLGALWYSPVMLGNRWMACIGKTPETLGSSTGPIVGSIIASLMSAIGVSLLFSMLGINNLSGALGLGVILGLLIIFPAFLSDSLFCGWGNELLMIQSGYRVVSIILMSLVLYLLG